MSIKGITRTLTVCTVFALAGLLSCQSASAQYPMVGHDVVTPGTVQTKVQQEVVGYQVQRRGLLGLRSEWNPVVAPVARTYVTPPKRTTVYTPAPMTVPAPVTTPAPVVVPLTTQPIQPIPTVAPVMPVVYQARY